MSCVRFLKSDQNALRKNYTSFLSTPHVSNSRQQILQYILANDEEIDCFDFSIDWSTARKILKPFPCVNLLLTMMPFLDAMFDSCLLYFVRTTIKISGKMIAVFSNMALVPVIGPLAPGLIRFLTAVRMKLLTTVWHPYFGALYEGRKLFRMFYFQLMFKKIADWHACSLRQDRVEKMRARFGERKGVFSDDEQAVIRNISGLDINFSCFTPDQMTILADIALAVFLILCYYFTYKWFIVPLIGADEPVNEDEGLVAIGPDGGTAAAAG